MEATDTLEDIKQDIRRTTLMQLKGFLTEVGEKPFRAKQIHEWLWQRSATSFAEMTTCPNRCASAWKPTL